MVNLSLAHLLTPANVKGLSKELSKNGWCFVELQNDLVMLVQVFNKGSEFLKKPLSLKKQVPLAARYHFESVCKNEEKKRQRGLTMRDAHANMGAPRPMPKGHVPEFSSSDLNNLERMLNETGGTPIVEGDEQPKFKVQTEAEEEDFAEEPEMMENADIVEEDDNEHGNIETQTPPQTPPLGATITEICSSPEHGEASSSQMEAVIEEYDITEPTTIPQESKRGRRARSASETRMTHKQQLIQVLKNGLPSLKVALGLQTPEESSPKSNSGGASLHPRPQTSSSAIDSARSSLGQALKKWFQSPREKERYSILCIPEIEQPVAAVIVRALKPVEACFRWNWRNGFDNSRGTLEVQLHNGIEIEIWLNFWRAVYRS